MTHVHPTHTIQQAVTVQGLRGGDSTTFHAGTTFVLQRTFVGGATRWTWRGSVAGPPPLFRARFRGTITLGRAGLAAVEAAASNEWGQSLPSGGSDGS